MKRVFKDRLNELFSYGFFPSGCGLNYNFFGHCKMSFDDAISAWHKIEHLDLNYIETTLLNALIKCKHKKCTLLFSGGADSTYLGLLMRDFGIDFKLLNLCYEDYDESKVAKEVGRDVLGVDVDVLNVDFKTLCNDLPEILLDTHSIFERGSVLLTWYLMKASNNVVVAGDSADYLFMPSFKKEHEAIKTNIFKHTIVSDLVRQQLDVPIYKYSNNALQALLFFDSLHEIPYYYAEKYNMFKSSTQEVILPYQDVSLLKYGLSCKTLHKQDNKYYLSEILKKYTDYKFFKKAFKVSYYKDARFIDRYYDKKLFYKFGLNKIQFTEDKDIKKIKLLCCLIEQWMVINDVRKIEK